jgi:NAD(P)-dependent dehydrogenase (short-subunit alcohol dehydrogenase family)
MRRPGTFVRYRAAMVSPSGPRPPVAPDRSSQRVFITGGASGFGEALAIRYAQAGHRVCIGDLHTERGEAALAKILRAGQRGGDHGGRGADHQPFFVVCDVTDEAQMIAAADALDDRWGGVDVVINNAGVAAAGAIDQVSEDDWAWIVGINLLGVARGCRVFAPRLVRQKSGTIVNVASMAGLIHPPTMAPYNATKAAVVALSETLAVELGPEGIQVSVVCPGFFRTNLVESLRTTNDHARKLTDKLVNQADRNADDIAEVTFRAIERGDFHILPHPEGRAIWTMKRMVPWKVYAKVLGSRTAKMRRR